MEPTWTDFVPVAMSPVAVAVSVVAVWVSVRTNKRLQAKQHRFELLATCLDDLSKRDDEVSQIIQVEVAGNYEYNESTPVGHYRRSLEIYQLIKHHLSDTDDLEGQIKHIDGYRARYRGGERKTPKGDQETQWDLRDALQIEYSTFVSMLKEAVAKALYGS